MNILRKPSKARITAAEYPQDIPKLTAAWDRSDLTAWSAKMDQWWFDFRQALDRQHAIMAEGLESERTALETEATAIREAETALREQLQALESAMGEPDSEVEALSEALARHVADATAHGGLTVVEDEPEPEPVPTLHVQPSRIRESETITIESDEHLIVAGPFAIRGRLLVSGHFTAL